MRILSITAGAASMYCGSCLRDNALAAELIRQGHDVTLLPFYTPTLTDEENVRQNQKVKKGEKLFELDSRIPRAALLAARAAVLSAQAELRRISAYRRKEEEPVLRAKIQQAEASVLEASSAVTEAQTALIQQAVSINDMKDQVSRLEKTEKGGA